MTGVVEALAKLGLELPPPPEAQAHYAPAVIIGNVVYLAGQTPRVGAQMKFAGQVGIDLDVDAARKAAELCALRLISALRQAVGDLDRVAGIGRLTVFVNAGPGFTGHSSVADGASDVFAAAFGSRGIHSRTAVGVASLPGNAAVEVDMVALLAEAGNPA